MKHEENVDLTTTAFPTTLSDWKDHYCYWKLSPGSAAETHAHAAYGNLSTQHTLHTVHVQDVPIKKQSLRKNSLSQLP